MPRTNSARERLAWCGCFLAAACAGSAQDFRQRGFIDTRSVFYPRTAANDSGRVIGESLLRYEASRSLLPGLRVFGAFDARTDTHRQVERKAHLNWNDRTAQRPAFAVRRLSATYSRGRFTAEAGKQFIRWGKTDILNPTDRFAPRDFLSVLDNEFLAVSAIRTTYEDGANTIDFVFQPLFTPSRTPLINQRWAPPPEEAAGIAFEDGPSLFPGRASYGVRVNHIGRGYEVSASFFNGYNHLPLLQPLVQPSATAPFRVQLQRYYPQLRQYGTDVAAPLRWFTVKAEAAYYGSTTQGADEYVLYVIQLERQSGEWSFVGGYAGEAVTERRNPVDFAPDRGLTRAFLGRASYTLDASRSFAVESAVRQDGAGAWLRFEFSQLLGQHWRWTYSTTLIGGERTDFLGQYRRNSHAAVSFRYSF